MTDHLPASASKPTGEIILYQTEDGTSRIEVRLEGNTVWLAQRGMAELFRTSVQNVNHYLKAIYEDGELRHEATIKGYLIVQTEGSRQVFRAVDHYNLKTNCQRSTPSLRKLPRARNRRNCSITPRWSCRPRRLRWA